MGMDMQIFVKKFAVKKYLEKNGFDYWFLNVLFGYELSPRFRVLSEAFQDERLYNVDESTVRGEFIQAFITAKKYDEEHYKWLVDLFKALFDMFGAENILVVGDYMDFDSPEYVLLNDIRDNIEEFLKKVIVDYDMFLKKSII